MAKKKSPEERAALFNKVLDDAAEVLGKEGVKYFLCIVDKNPKAPDGGKVHVSSDITSNEMITVLDVAMPTTQDITNLGIHVGELIRARLKRRNQTLKGQ